MCRSESTSTAASDPPRWRRSRSCSRQWPILHRSRGRSVCTAPSPSSGRQWGREWIDGGSGGWSTRRTPSTEDRMRTARPLRRNSRAQSCVSDPKRDLRDGRRLHRRRRRRRSRRELGRDSPVGRSRPTTTPRRATMTPTRLRLTTVHHHCDVHRQGGARGAPVWRVGCARRRPTGSSGTPALGSSGARLRASAHTQVRARSRRAVPVHVLLCTTLALQRQKREWP